MTYEYSEDKLIEQTAIKLFKELKWETANVYHDETFGKDGTIGRNSEADVILAGHFFDAIRKYNPGLPEQAYINAFEFISSETSTKLLAEINYEKYNLLRDGIPVTFKNEKGKIVRNKKLKVFDFDNYENNNFIAVQQLWVEGKSRRKRRPDVIGFVNGLPLLFVELKAHHRKLKTAYDHNLSDYKDVIPKLFHYNAFIILSNGLDSKIGSLISGYDHFHDWKRIREDEEGVVSMETILRGVCSKNMFMDMFENFVLYDTSLGKIIKLVALNHQFLGVNKAIDHFINLKGQYSHGEIDIETKQKLGIFWHTQGSGKSYSMVFFCQKIHRKVEGSYTFLLVTDRLELDSQIYGTFAGVRAVTSKEAKAKSGEDLKDKLKSDSRYIFSIIHKFNFDEVITERDDIIVISDEAHRTQGGTLAMNMRKAMPKASYVGFTGTPLFKDDEITRRIFGDYVSIYDFKRSVEDGATVPLYYENRGEKLKLDNPKINEDIRNAIEEAELDSNQEDKLKNLFSRDYPILTSKKRLKSIAKDVVYHFNNRGYKGKGMMVTLDKLTAVKMYNYVKEAWEDFIKNRENEIKLMSNEQEQLISTRELKWTKETEIAVVVSSEQNEIKKFRAWGLDIEPHRAKMNDPTRDLETEFKKEDHPFRFVIVCAMWITGFDVKSLSTLYLDKPLKSHTLMQTIARANRVNEGKNNGLIVDYIETYKNLLEALAIYAVGGEKGEGTGVDVPVRPLEELVEDLKQSIDTTIKFLYGEVNFKLESIINTEGFDKLAAIQKGVNTVYTTDETKNKFGVMSRDVFKKYKALMPDKAIYLFKDRRDAIDAIYSRIQQNTEEADISYVMKQVQDVVDESIESLNILLEPTEDYGKKVDISSLDFELIEKEFLKFENKNTMVQSLKQKIENKLNQMLINNPLRIDFYEKYKEIIDEYNKGKEAVTIEETFERLLNFVRKLSEEDARASKEDLSEPQLAIFDLLRQGKKLSEKEKNKIKNIASDLLETLDSNELKVNHWMDKPQTSSAVKTAINNYLFKELPYPTYEEKDIESKSFLIFDYLRLSYGAVG